MKFLRIIIFLLPTVIFSQEFGINGSVEGQAILSSQDENPFWFHTNTNYAVGELTNLSVTGALKADYKFSNFDLYAGASVFGRDGVPNSVQRKELYLEFENSWLRATLGSKSREIVADGLSATNKNFLWSGNARPLPGIILEANNPIKISNTFAIDWGIAHYQLNDDRFVRNTRVHYKRLGLITTFNENNKLTAQIQHFAQWGGTSSVYGKLKDGFKDFINVFFAHSSQELGTENEIINKVGNHLGSYLLDYEFKNSWGKFSLYHEHPFEDGSGTALANFPDGIWGIFYRPQNQNIISSILYEYIDTSDQSGNDGGSGFDGYFGNNVYRSGWSYEENVIGLPFILYDKNVVITENTSPYISNRSQIHHFGIAGNFNKFEWKLKSTYAKYLGTYRHPFTPTLKNWYNFASLAYNTEKMGTFTVMAGADFSNLAENVAGGSLMYSYKF